MEHLKQKAFENIWTWKTWHFNDAFTLLVPAQLDSLLARRPPFSIADSRPTPSKQLVIIATPHTQLLWSGGFSYGRCGQPPGVALQGGAARAHKKKKIRAFSIIDHMADLGTGVSRASPPSTTPPVRNRAPPNRHLEPPLTDKNTH